VSRTLMKLACLTASAGDGPGVPILWLTPTPWSPAGRKWVGSRGPALAVRVFATVYLRIADVVAQCRPPPVLFALADSVLPPTDEYHCRQG
jgi:hypothetical protein